MASIRPESVIRQRRRSLQRDPNSLTASVAVMTGPGRSKARMDVSAWQQAAWTFYDEIGELRFGVNWLANALSRVNLVAAIPPAQQGDEPTPIDLEIMPSMGRAVELVNQIAGGVTGQGQLLAGAAKQLTVPGVGYVLATADTLTDSFSTWRVLSNEECRMQAGETQTADSETGEWVSLGPNDLLIKVWRSHPRHSWEPDSPVRSVLGSLGEIKLLTMRIAADARSRLAGNGLLIIPEEAEFPPGQGNVQGAGEDADEFIETFIQVTQIPITDQASPAATTPLVIRMPGEFVAAVQHLTFYSAFDTNLDVLRQAAVKRLALGLDMPPDVLLGMGDANHWSAWQIAEEAITLHVEPLAETICHALTVGFLRAALTSEGLDPDSAIVWYDTTDLSTRPDRSAQAELAHTKVKISDAAYLGYLGLDDGDKPDPVEELRRILVDLAMANPANAPALLAAAGYPVNVTALTPPMSAPAPGQFGPPQDTTPPGTPADGPPPQPDQAPQDQQPALAAALLSASDGLVYRALERAGLRLRSAAGKGKGGATSIVCADPTTLHCEVSATAHASLDHLLEGAWARVPEIARRNSVDPDSLVACLDGYTRALLAAGHAHTYHRLSNALGMVSDDRLVSA